MAIVYLILLDYLRHITEPESIYDVFRQNFNDEIVINAVNSLIITSLTVT